MKKYFKNFKINFFDDPRKYKLPKLDGFDLPEDENIYFENNGGSNTKFMYGRLRGTNKYCKIAKVTKLFSILPFLFFGIINFINALLLPFTSMVCLGIIYMVIFSYFAVIINYKDIKMLYGVDKCRILGN